MAETPCALCGGTGKVVLMNSWCIADGTRRARCDICGGTGKSEYRPEEDVIARQGELRARAGQKAATPTATTETAEGGG